MEMDANEYLVLLLKYSHDREATDVHVCAGSCPLIRVNGLLCEISEMGVVSPTLIMKIIECLLEPKKRQRLEEKRVLDFSFSKSGLGRFRTNIYSQRGTYAIAIRMLPFEIPEFSSLGLPDIVESFIHKTKGLFLATGATGSGKSTTLASLLDLINTNYNYHVITIEDPIEYLHKHKKSLMTQREIGDDADTFANALRSALREDPDVILVGEMRDYETISIALTAAETGHLVFSTLHTVGAAKSIDRIIDAFPSSQQNQVRSQLATVLEGVVSQQLVPRADKSGLVVASEVMIVNPAIRNLVREGRHYQINSIMQTGQTKGMQLLDADLADLCNRGVIDIDSAMLFAQDQQLLSRFLTRR